MANLASATPTPIKYEIFLAYAGRDRSAAERLYALLARPGLRVFLDTLAILPGESWDLTIQHAQRASRMTVVLVGPKWEFAFFLRSEVQTAISLFRLDAERHRVVPVFLPGTHPNDSPYGLNVTQGIRLASDGDFPEVARQILSRLTAIVPIDA